jgi:hypothetical protein
MMDLFAAARQLQDFCDGQGWREPRVTRDVDLTVMAGFAAEQRYIGALLAAYPARIKDAAEFARGHRVLLLKTADRVGIDVSLGALPFEELVVSRAI